MLTKVTWTGSNSIGSNSIKIVVASTDSFDHSSNYFIARVVRFTIKVGCSHSIIDYSSR